MGDAMIRFDKRLQSLRNPVPGSEDGFFYIHEQLRGIVTKDPVVDSVSLWIPDQILEEAVVSIMADGIRLFSILALMGRVDQITNFLAHSTLDSRLPIQEEAEFRRIAPELDILFFTKFQWQFFPWVFRKDSGHLVFPSRTILPFISEDEIATNSSGGVISRVIIPVLQQGFFSSQDGQPVRIVRKKIKPARTPEATENIFKDEKDCLELYRRLRNPNIIPLLGSFTLRGEHNLLFPSYPMNLEDFLQKDKFGEFNNNSTFTAAVAGLASALQCVHEAHWRSRTTPTLYTRYGYHHDFRPANILVTDTTFILADFGLAYPRPSPEPPVTPWVGNLGHYIAPECMNSSFEHQKVGRSYDIWAFGCFLCEIATYIHQGPSGIQDFRILRITDTYYEERYRNGYFFDGPSSSLKPQVDNWLNFLSNKAQNHIVVSLISLSRKMLQFNPGDRLDMRAHSIRLSFIHAKALFRLAVESIEHTLSQLGQLPFAVSFHTAEELKLELSKLRTFGNVLRMDDDKKVDCERFKDASFADLVKGCLSQISTNHRSSRIDPAQYTHVWTSSESQPGVIKTLKPLKFLDKSIREEVRKLAEALPDQKNFWYLLRQRHFNSSLTEESLRVLEEHGEEAPDLYAEIGLHAKLQRLDQALQKGTGTAGIDGDNLILDWSQVSLNLGTFGRYHHLGTYKFCGPDGAEDTRKVLIEWIFVSQIPESEREDVRIDRLLRLARLLHCPKPAGFLTLDCLGFLSPKPGTNGYGFVYPFPGDKGSTETTTPISLRSLLDKAKFSITLGDKFKIAKALSNNLFQLHGHDWLHKNVCSDNVIFFSDEIKEDKDQKATYEMASGPYIIGFHHGRPDSDEFQSDVLSSEASPEAFLYQHPRYKPGDNRFRKIYDYYGLGVILLELAFWLPATKLRERYSGGSLVGEQLQNMDAT